MSRVRLASLLLVGLFAVAWFTLSPVPALLYLATGLATAVIVLGLNIQWGYAGLFNAGILGFIALGGYAVVLVSVPSVPEAIDAGGQGLLSTAIRLGVTLVAIYVLGKMRGPLPGGLVRTLQVIDGIAGYL